MGGRLKLKPSLSGAMVFELNFKEIRFSLKFPPTSIFCLISVISKQFVKTKELPEPQASVMHPWLASSTTLIYLYKVP